MSIVINNFNYGRFLLQAIDSALAQDDDNFEVIVVDDGSTDGSLAIARGRTSRRLILIEKANGGQASAINAGFAASTGQWVMFLDADDWYEPDAVRTLRSEFRDGLSKIHFPLLQFTGIQGELRIAGPKNLSRGNVLDEIAETGNYIWPATSGNIFRREALAKIMPIPEKEFRICADIYLCLMIAAEGAIGTVDRPLGNYRVHGDNAYARNSIGLTKKYLFTHAVCVLRLEQLAGKVLRETGNVARSTVMEKRENLELVALAARFGSIRLEDFGLSVKELNERWQACYRKSPRALKGRIPALLIWKVIEWGPRWAVSPFIWFLWTRRRRRAARNTPS